MISRIEIDCSAHDFTAIEEFACDISAGIALFTRPMFAHFVAAEYKLFRTRYRARSSLNNLRVSPQPIIRKLREIIRAE